MHTGGLTMLVVLWLPQALLVVAAAAAVLFSFCPPRFWGVPLSLPLPVAEQGIQQQPGGTVLAPLVRLVSVCACPSTSTGGGCLRDHMLCTPCHCCNCHYGAVAAATPASAGVHVHMLVAAEHCCHSVSASCTRKFENL